MNLACNLLLLLSVANFCQLCSAFWPWEGKNTMISEMALLHTDKQTFTTNKRLHKSLFELP